MDPGTSGYSLRFRVNAIVAALMSLFVIALLVLQIQATRHGVQEEIVGANRVAGQLLERVGWIPATTILFAVVARAFGSRRLVVDVAIGVALTALAYVVFNWGLGLSLPLGSVIESMIADPAP